MIANCKRSHNYTASEKELLLTIFEKFKSVIECKKTDTQSVRDKQTAWKDLTAVFNSQSTHVPRSDDQLKSVWKNIKGQNSKAVQPEFIC